MTLACSPSPLSRSPYRMSEAPESDDAPREGAQLVTADGRSLPLASAALTVVAGGGLARVVLEQRFENPYRENLRVTYRMPLPADGAISGYAFQVGQRTITGRVERKELARERFESALAEGKTAALLEQERADIFTQDIGNLPPGESLVARITIDQRLSWRVEGGWELRFPTVIGPRYIGSSETEEDARGVHVDVAPAGVRARIHLELRVKDGLTPGSRVESPSHSLHTRSDSVIELQALEGARLDRDIVVRWATARPEVGLKVQVARPEASALHGQSAYALLSITPPEPGAAFPTLPRDLIVLLDTSGSMGGPPLEQAKRVVLALIDALGEQDRLEIVEFSTRPNRYTKGPVPATPREKQEASRWVTSRTAGGGTEMYSGILAALKSLRAGAQRQVVLLTDGYVGGEEQLVTLLHESLPEACRMHVVGVGSAVNRTLSTSIARAGRGQEILVGPDEDARAASRALLHKTSSPVLTDLSIEGDAVIDRAPEHVPDVFAGSPVLAALQVRPQGGEIVVRGKLASGSWEQRVLVPAAGAGEGDQAIVTLYARERVADLELRWTIGRQKSEIDREIESLGTAFQISTRRTSWVAIDEDRSVDPGSGTRQESIPQELPYGTSLASFGLVAAVPGGAVFAAPGAAPVSFGASMPMPMAQAMPISVSALARRPTLESRAGMGAPTGHMAMPPPSMAKRSGSGLKILLILLFLLALVALVAWLLLR